jgi:Uma2 family endonuclease
MSAEMAVIPKLMTAEELIRLPGGRARHELVRGVLRTMPLATMPEACVTSKISQSLWPQTEDRRLGALVNGFGFLLTSDPDTVRAPDVGFISRERLDAAGNVPGYFPGAPDLVVEVIAPDDLYLDVHDKIADWLEHGTRVVFVVNPSRRTVAVHRRGPSFQILSVDDVLTAEDVVPGWSMAVRDLFDLS